MPASGKLRKRDPRDPLAEAELQPGQQSAPSRGLNRVRDEMNTMVVPSFPAVFDVRLDFLGAQRRHYNTIETRPTRLVP